MDSIKQDTIVQDVAEPIARLPATLSLVREVAAKYGVTIVQMAHAGDDNLHPHLLYNPYDDEEYERCLKASHDIFQSALEAGGTLTGEHGIGLEKISFMDKQFSRDELDFMAQIKMIMDQDGSLNPGKVLPLTCFPERLQGSSILNTPKRPGT